MDRCEAEVAPAGVFRAMSLSEELCAGDLADSPAGLEQEREANMVSIEGSSDEGSLGTKSPTVVEAVATAAGEVVEKLSMELRVAFAFIAVFMVALFGAGASVVLYLSHLN